MEPTKEPSPTTEDALLTSTPLVSQAAKDFRTLKFVLVAVVLVISIGVVACVMVWHFVSLRMFSYVAFVTAVCAVCLMFALLTAKFLLDADEGTESMRRVATCHSRGCRGVHLHTIRDYCQDERRRRRSLSLSRTLCASPSVEMAILFLARLGLAGMTLVCFFIGACFSGTAGFVGLWTSVRVNLRVAVAASGLNYPNAFYYALRGGLACGVFVVGLCVMGLCLLFTFFHVMIGDTEEVTRRMPHYLVGYGFRRRALLPCLHSWAEASTRKRPTSGADLVGKVEAGIPEDDPRNPAVIADLVGDNGR